MRELFRIHRQMLVIVLFAFAADLLAGDVRIQPWQETEWLPLPRPRPIMLCYWSLGTGCLKPYDDRYPGQLEDARVMGKSFNWYEEDPRPVKILPR
jgi:hypothetical protein